MSEAFAQSILKVAMAQICQNLGWHAVQTSPMNILVDILRRYISTLAKITHQYSEHYNHTEPNLNDLGLAFKEMGISLNELEEYINNVEPVPFVHPVPKFPVRQSSQFHFPKEGCREVQHRPEWIHSHLPPAYPDLEDEEPLPSPSTTLDRKEFIDGLASSVEIGVTSPCGSPRPGMRRPLEVSQDNFSTPKRPRLQSEEEGRPMREVMSVTMTAAGIISPVREGRLPDACTPSKGFEDSRPASPVVPEVLEPVPSPTVPTPTEMHIDTIQEEIIEKVKTKPVPKVKEGKKLKVRKDNKENKKKIIKEGKLKKKETFGKIKPLGRPPKIPRVKKEKLDKVLKKPDVGHPKVPKIPKVPQPKIPKSKEGKGSMKMEKNVAARDGPKPSNKPGRKHNTKVPKPPKVPKLKRRSPKAERLVPGGQLANLLAKASGAATVKAEKMSVDSSKIPSVREKDFPLPKLELPITPSACDSPEHLIIDDNSVSEGQDRESRLASLDECISAVIQHGMQSEHHTANSNSSSNARSDSEGIPSVPSRIKLEPRDVYDFTDDEEVPGVNKPIEEPISFPPPLVLSSPPLKRKDEDRDKPKEPRKTKKRDVEKKPKKQRGRSPKFIKCEQDNLMEITRPRTPEPIEDSNDVDTLSNSFVGVPAPGVSMLSPRALSSLSHIPPALLPFSMQGYPPQTVCSFLGSGGPPSGLPTPGLPSHVPYPKLVDLADVAISKARNEGDFDVGKPKEKEKEKEKTKRKEKREKKEKDKVKVKKKREKAKDKVIDKTSDKDHEKGKGRKSKGPTAKTKEKKEKVDKTKEKEKKKEKAKEKVKEKKVEKKKKEKEKGVKKEKQEKQKEELDVECGSPSINNLPRLTFKLGSGMPSDGTKIVIKGLSNADSPSSSPVPQITEQSPPLSPPLPPVVQQRVAPPPPPPPPLGQGMMTSAGKSHPKPQSKAQPMPPAPARTVITKTVGTIIDEAGNKIWICPACTLPDDGSPMIGCDDCDEWYHWVCVGIVVPPKEDENWFCTRCISKKQSTQGRKRKHRKEK